MSTVISRRNGLIGDASRENRARCRTHRHRLPKREIRIASLFRQAPAAFLRMIVVHELAHLKERGHDKAFYALCTHMEPAYHLLEFDVRLWLTALANSRKAPSNTSTGCPP